MHRMLSAFVLSPVVIFCVVASAHKSFGQNQPISVSVFSDVHIPQHLLAVSEQSASQIFSNAGINVAWINCVHALDAIPDPDCAKSYGPGDFVLRITSHVSSATRDSACGVAWLGAGGTGMYADIFWTRAQQLQIHSGVDLGLILGSVMAHEMGHLLLGANSHSVAGLMQAHWRSEELDRIAVGTLLFLPEQSQRMRARLSAVAVTMAVSRNGRPGIRP